LVAASGIFDLGVVAVSLRLAGAGVDAAGLLGVLLVLVGVGVVGVVFAVFTWCLHPFAATNSAAKATPANICDFI
jgi:hypothetical protein